MFSLILFLFLILFSFYFIRLEKNKSLLLSVGIIFFIELLWELISCLYLDYNNAYIIETARTSYHTGAFIRMLILYIPLILILSSKKSGKLENVYNLPLYIKKINKRQSIRIVLIITLFVVLYCFMDMVISGIPLFSPIIGRQNFSQFSTLPFATRLNGEITFFGVFVAGIAFFNEDNKTNKHLAVCILVISIFYRLMMEYKYHGMYNIFYAFFLPGLIKWYKKKNYNIISLKNIIKVSSILIIVLTLSYYTYSNVNKNFDTKSLLFDRIFALQAHTFWGMDEKAWVVDDVKDGYKESLKNEISAVANSKGEMDFNSGIYNVMSKVSNYITVRANYESRVRWAGSYLTVGINTIGYFFTFIISAFLAIIILLDIKLLYSSLFNCELVILYFSQSLMWDLLDYFRVGNWCIILNTKTILTFSILFLLFLLKKRNYKIKKMKSGVLNG